VAAGLVLGSGLSGLADELADRITVPYADIPGFPRATVPGHAGNFVVGTLEGTPVACAQGRFHLYEGWDPPAVALPVRVLHALGARWILVTNAAGSLDPRLEPGSLMAIRDHLNLQFASPLRGRAPEAIENPFPDMSNAWDERLRERLHAVALAEGIALAEGVYAGVSGPTYETPAEIRFLKRIGADAIGMSTVGEAIVAAEIGVPLVGISLITNAAAGLSDHPLLHEDVTEIAGRTAERLARLVRAFVRAEPADV
jgi:purine-nucleoside phosphorylase